MTDGTELYVLLAACCERIVRNVLGRLSDAGYGHLTPSQAITVLLLGNGVDTVTQIAERLDMTTQAVSKICAVLHAEGLLDREPHSEDARSRHLALTTEGRRVFDTLRDAGNEAEQTWTELVGPDTIATVRTALAAYAGSPAQYPNAAPVRIRFS